MGCALTAARPSCRPDRWRLCLWASPMAGNVLGQQHAQHAAAATVRGPWSQSSRSKGARPGSSPLWPRPPCLNIAVQLRDAGLPPPTRPACLGGAVGCRGVGRSGGEETGTSRTFVGTGCQAGLGRRQPPQRGTEGTSDRGTEPEPCLPACWPSQPVRVPGTALPGAGAAGLCPWASGGLEERAAPRRGHRPGAELWLRVCHLPAGSTACLVCGGSLAPAPLEEAEMRWLRRELGREDAGNVSCGSHGARAWQERPPGVCPLPEALCCWDVATKGWQTVVAKTWTQRDAAGPPAQSLSPCLCRGNRTLPHVARRDRPQSMKA